MRVFRDGELGVGSIFFFITTSLASGGVMILSGFVVVVGGCDVVTSILKSMGFQVSDVCSAFSAWAGPVFWVFLRSGWGSLIPLLGVVEAPWASSIWSRLHVMFRL
jgi:hypothetical protein